MSSSINAPHLAAHLLQSSPLLIDVREPWEFEICHIDGSTNMPMGQIPQRLQELPGDGEMVVICHHGVRSQQVIHFLRSQTSLRLINLDGGVDAWARSVDRDMPVY